MPDMNAERWEPGRRAWRTALLALPLLALAACQSAPSRLYTLAPLPPETAPPADGRGPATLAIGTVELPMLIDRPEIVRRIDANRVEALDFDRWGEPLADGLRMTLAADLSSRLPGTNVLPMAGPSGHGASGAGMAVLTVTVLRFDADAAGRVTLDAQWSLSNGGGTRPSPRRDRVETGPGGTEPGALVPTMSRAVAGLADRIAAQIASQTARAGEPKR